MKKILLIGSLLAFIFSGYGQNQTVCSNSPIKRWTGTGTPGDLVNARAGTGGLNLFTIDGSNADWEEHIAGPLNTAYTTGSIPTYQPDPYSSPVAAGNVQLDGLGGITTGANYDRDRPGQDHRDLRYFAFTYDRANVYFLFRRPGNNTSQVSFYYFIDINVDGFMKTGEPVIKVDYNGGTATARIFYYVEDISSNTSYATGSWVSGKGNSMVATVARAGSFTPKKSQWVIGSADGWSMPGSVSAANLAQLPALGVVSGVNEVFLAKGITTAGNTGYAAEFAIPWNYFRYYSGDATYTGTPAQKILTYQNIFTWHVSLDNGGGNTNSNDDEDNAGGCCSGLAASGTANVTVTGTSTLAPVSTYSSNTQYVSKVKYLENAGAVTTVTMNKVVISGLLPSPLPGSVDPTAFNVIVYKDANNDGLADDAGTIYLYNSGVSSPPTSYTYIASPGSAINVVQNGMISFITTVDMITPGVKTFTLETTTDNEIFNTGSTACGGQNQTANTQSQLTITTPLPVDFKSFTATRNKANVMLKWVTATEKNNDGFAVERNVNGNWEQVAYVNSQALSGNSIQDLSYQYIDYNNAKGISQYRIKQVDFDSKSKYTEVRSVKGDGQMGGIVVYPNPTVDGRINVVFDDASVSHDISVIDMSGRTVRQISGIANNNITIDNLMPGMYSLRVFVPATGEQSVMKVVVNKR